MVEIKMTDEQNAKSEGTLGLSAETATRLSNVAKDLIKNNHKQKTLFNGIKKIAEASEDNVEFAYGIFAYANLLITFGGIGVELLKTSGEKEGVED